MIGLPAIESNILRLIVVSHCAAPNHLRPDHSDANRVDRDHSGANQAVPGATGLGCLASDSRVPGESVTPPELFVVN